MTTSDVTTASEEARVQLIPVPIASPGQCVYCGKNQCTGGFIAPGLDFEFHGTFYLCAECGGEWANLLGFISPDQAIKLAQYIQDLKQENELLKTSLENLESAVEHLTNYRMLRNTSSDINNPIDVSGSTDETSEINTKTISGTVVEFPGKTNGSEPTANESISEQRTDDVPSVTSSESAVDIIDL